MSCWVVPSIAAELWGVSLDHIQQCLKDGSVASKKEHGFTFVDIAPNSPKLEATIAQAPAVKPVTFVPTMQIEVQEVAQTEDDLPMDDEEVRTLSIADWRQTREAMARQRRAPLAA